MVIADLQTTCSICKGSGFVAGFNEYSTHTINPQKKCPSCSGHGVHLTELGQEVWQLFQPLIREMIQSEISKLKMI